MGENETKEPEDTQLSKEDQVEKLAGEIETYDRRIESFQKDLPKLESDLQDEDLLIAEKVSEELDKFPDSTPKGLLDKIYKLSLPKRGQLKESINKLEIAIAHTRIKRRKVVAEKVAIEKEIEEEQQLTEAKKLYALLQDVVRQYQEVELCFDSFKTEVAAASDGWALKIQEFYQELDWPKDLMTVLLFLGDSHLKKASLPGLSLTHFIEQAAGVASGYSPNPLDLMKDVTRQTGSWIGSGEYSEQGIEGIEHSEAAGDQAAMNRLGEIFSE